MIRRLAESYVRFSHGKEWPIVIFALLLCGFGYYRFVTAVSIDPQIEALLPESAPSRLALDEASERLPSSSPLYVVIESEDAALTAQVRDSIRDQLEAWDEAPSVIVRRDPAYFLDRRLLYVEAEAIQRLADDTREYLRYSRCEQIPGCMNLLDEPPEPDFDSVRETLASDPKVSTLLHFFGADELPEPRAAPTAEAESNGEEDPHQETNHAEELGYLCEEDGLTCVVQATLRGNVSNFDYASMVHARVLEMIEEASPEGAPDSLRAEVTGRVRGLVENKASVENDLAKTASLSLFLVLFVLGAQFRKPRALLVLITPLIVSMGLTGLVCSFVAPSLNIVSAATLAVLIGLGIDFGLHLTIHYGSLREKGLEPEKAVEESVGELSGSLLVAAMTTSCGFAALMASGFQGFVQMGLLAATGVVLALLSYFIVFPPLVTGLHRLRAESGVMTREIKLPGFLTDRPPKTRARTIAGVGVLLIIGGLFALPSVQFEDNYRNLSPKSPEPGLSHSGSVRGTSRSPILILADDQQALNQVTTGLLERYPDGLYDDDSPWLLTPALFVPDDQEARLAAIGELHDAVNEARRYLSDEERARVDAWEPMLSIEDGITEDDLPQWVRGSLDDNDGNFGTFAIGYLPYSGMDATAMEMVAEDLQQWREDYPGTVIASTGALLGEVTKLLREAAPLIIGLALLGLVIACLFISRSLKTTLLVLSSVLAAMLTLAIGMALFDVRVNLYNLVVLPVAFGIGVDGAIYVVWSLDKSKKHNFSSPPVIRAVIGSTMTTMAAFGSMWVSVNPGLLSLASLAVLALSITLFANLIWTPSLVATFTPEGEDQHGDRLATQDKSVL